MLRMLSFKGGRPIVVKTLPQKEPIWIDCDSLTPEVLSLIKDAGKVINGIHSKITLRYGQTSFVSTWFLNEKMQPDTAWIFVVPGAVITRVKRSEEWERIMERLEREGNTKYLDEAQIFTYIFAEIVENNGTRLDTMINKKMTGMKPIFSIILRDEKEAIKKLISKKLPIYNIKEQQFDLLKEVNEGLKMQEELFGSF